MKIRKINIKGYKVFDDITLDFTDNEGNTLDTVVLAGVNGSGKTTILELIEKLFNNRYQKDRQLDLEDGHSYYDTAERYISAKNINIELEMPDKVSKIFEENTKGIKWTEDFNPIIQSINLDSTLLKLFYESTLYQNVVSMKSNFSFLMLLFNKLTSKKIYYIPAHTNILEPIERSHNGNNQSLKEITNRIKNPPGTHYLTEKLDFREHKQWVERFIVETATQEIFNNRAIAPEITIKNFTSSINHILEKVNVSTKLIDVTSEEPIFESFNGQKISIDDLSSGEKQLFYRAVYLRNMNINNSIILVDEVETSLHPTWQQEILKLYQNIGENNQVIVSTHSPHVISSVKPENLFVLYPNEETKKIEVINMAEEHKHTKGLEPNRILKEIMGTPLRDYDTQVKIEKVSTSLREKDYEKSEIQALIQELTENLGRQDPFIMKMNHQIMMLEREKTKMIN